MRLSALFSRGVAYKCWLTVKAGLVEVVYCPEMVAELTEKLYDKFDYSADDVRSVVYEVRRFGREVEISGKLHAVVADPDDDIFIECALVAGATLIISNDRHLLKMDGYQGIRVVPPIDFLAWLANNT